MSKILFYIVTLTCPWASQCFSQMWLPVGQGIGCNNAERVHDINVSTDNSKILISGLMIQNGLCDTMLAVLSYNGIQLQEVAEPLIGAESTLAFDYQNKTYASGYFVSQPGADLRFNVKTEEGIWDTVPNSIEGSCHDYLIHNGMVYLSGWLEHCGGLPCSLVASFDGEQVLPYYTGPDASGFGYAVEAYQDTIFVAGTCSATDGSQHEGFNNCLKIVDGQLEKVGQGFPLSGGFFDLEVHDDKLYMSGWAPTFGNSEWHTIYYYEHGQLHTLPTEPDSRVKAIKSYNGGLYVAGDFSNIGNMPCNNVARWDGQTWTCLSNDMFYYQDGVNCVVNCINDIEIWNDTLYIGGRFHTIGADTLKRIAKLDMALSEAFPVSITEQQRQELKLIVYPNPAKHELNIVLPLGADAKDRITIYDLHGRLLQEQTTGKYGGPLVMDVESLSAGVYFIKYTSNDKLLTKSFVKE